MGMGLVIWNSTNRIVTQFETSKLYLIKVYDLNDDNFIIGLEREKYDIQMLKFEIPKIIDTCGYEDLNSKYGSKTTPYTLMGVTIINKITGERTKNRNPVFERVRRLRGNQSNIKYQYLVLKKDGNVKKFLKYFPEHTGRFSECRDKLHKFTTNLYLSYR